MARNLWLVVGLAAILLVALTGVSDAVDPWNVQDNTETPAGVLDAGHVIAQTFVSHAARLHAVQVRWIVSDDFASQPSGRVTLHLRRRIRDSADLAAVSIPTRDLQNNAYTTFTFAPLADSENQSFAFFIDASQAEIQRGSLSLWASRGDAYPDGQMYLDETATYHDLVFRAYDDPDLPMLAAALGQLLVRYGGALVLILIFLLVPGLALVSLDDGWHASERIALAGGITCAIVAAASLLLLLVPFTFNPWVIIAVAGLIVLFAAWRLRHRIIIRPQLEPCLLVVLALLSLIIGLVQIRDVAAPLWVDSPTHADFIQSLLDEGRLPASIFYHLGYHAITALVVRLTGLGIPGAMLLVGQVLITQTGLSVYVLSRRLSGNAWAGLAAASVVWFLSPTPAYFITWGRYPLLLGGALLPLALFSAIDLIDAARLDFVKLAFAIVLFVGLSFAHIRLVVFYIVFVAIYLIYRRGWVRWSRWMLVASAGALFAAAWFFFLSMRGIGWNAIWALNATPSILDLGTAVSVSLLQHGRAVWLFALIALGLGIVRARPITWILLAWYIGVGIIVLLPMREVGGEYLSTGFVVLMGYLPAALVIGDAIQPEGVWKPLASLAFALIVLLGARTIVSIVNPATILFSPADAQAMEWIRTSTPPDSKFLVNSFNWTGDVYAPSDGGIWIPYMAGRPVSYLTTASQADASSLARWVASQQITYLYFGERGGVLDRADLDAQPEKYARVYNSGGVEIYRVIK